MTSLFTPLHLGGLSLKNRAVRSATQDDLGTAQGLMTRQELALYTLLARQNVGLIFSAHCYVSPEGKASPLQNGLDSDKNLPMLRKIAQSVHEEGACMAMQISHAGLKAPGGKGPSDFSLQELENLKQAFVRSALYALGDIRRMGCDLGGNNSLPHIVHVRKAQMLRRGHVAQEGSTIGRRDGAADGCRDMVIAGGHIRNQRAQHVEGSALADGLLDLHVGRDLV